MSRSKKHYQSSIKDNSGASTGSHQGRGGVKGKMLDTDGSMTGKTRKRYENQAKSYWGPKADEAAKQLHLTLQRIGLR